MLMNYSAVFGPSIGPTLTTFAVSARDDWRVAFWIQLGITALAFVTVFFLLPETSAQTLLLRRARRLRKLTGNKNLRSQSEIDQAGLNMRAKLGDALLKPFQIALLDPAIL